MEIRSIVSKTLDPNRINY